MSATDEEVTSFFKRSAALASSLIGSVGGATAGLAIGGPPGAIIGSFVAPIVTDSLERLTGEFINRQLGARQDIRAGAGLSLLEVAIKEHLSRGEKVREGEFAAADESGRRPIDELTEQAILAMINAVDERRIPYLANFYAALYFDETIHRTSIPTLAAAADSLNYRAMCILNLISSGISYTDEIICDIWCETDIIIAKEVYSLIFNSVLAYKAINSDRYVSVTGYGEFNPELLVFTPIGKNLFDKMRLKDITSDEISIAETRSSFRNIHSLIGLENWSDISASYNK